MMDRWMIRLGAGMCAAAVLLGGCAPQNAATDRAQAEQRQVYASITDDMGKTVTLAEKPQRVVVLSTSLLNFAAAVGGDLAGRATVKSEDAPLLYSNRQVSDVGPVYIVSTEKIVELHPDLVIASESQHKNIVPILEQNHIPVITLKSKTYDDVRRNLAIIGTIYGKEDEAKAKIAAMDAAIQAVADAVPKEQKKIAIIHATPSSVTVELSGSIAGNIASLLHFTNVADGAGGDTDTDKVPYSIEALVEQNPDVIFFTSMGPKDKIERTIQTSVKGSPAWSSLQAVWEGRVYVLPENYFLLNPGLDYPDAVAYMARLVYPEAGL